MDWWQNTYRHFQVPIVALEDRNVDELEKETMN